MGGEPSGEIVERVVASVDKAQHCGTEPRLDFANAGAGAVEVGRQHAGPQPRRGEIEAVLCRSQPPVGRQSQPLGAVVEALPCRTDQILRLGKAASEAREPIMPSVRSIWNRSP